MQSSQVRYSYSFFSPGTLVHGSQGFVTSTHETLTPERETALKKRADELLTEFVGTTEDIAEAYLYLARAKYTTGTRGQTFA